MVIPPGEYFLPDGMEFTEVDGGRVEFHDVCGKRIAPVKIGPKTWRVHTGESPVYFTGARIKL